MPGSTSLKVQEVFVKLRNHSIEDASYMEKIIKETWPGVTNLSFSVAPITRDESQLRITLFGVKDGKHVFISKRLGEKSPVEFSKNK